MDHMGPPPPFTAIAAGTEALRCVVQESMIDVNAHMNFENYLPLAMEAMRPLIDDALGMGETYATRGLGLFVVEHRMRYLAEVRVGQELTGHTWLLASAAGSLVAESALLNRTAGRTAYVLRTQYVHVDLGSRRAVDFPADVEARLKGCVRTWRSPHRPSSPVP
jgi:acyl-CoA thioester hydrolase